MNACPLSAFPHGLRLQALLKSHSLLSASWARPPQAAQFPANGCRMPVLHPHRPGKGPGCSRCPGGDKHRVQPRSFVFSVFPRVRHTPIALPRHCVAKTHVMHKLKQSHPKGACLHAWSKGHSHRRRSGGFKVRMSCHQTLLFTSWDALSGSSEPMFAHEVDKHSADSRPSWVSTQSNSHRVPSHTTPAYGRRSINGPN